MASIDDLEHRSVKRQRGHDIDSNYSLNVPPLVSFPNLNSVSDDQTNYFSSSTSSNFPRFFTAKALAVDTNLKSVSPFLVYKTLQGMVGTSTKYTKLRSGDILFECDTQTQSLKLNELKKIGNDIDIICRPHPTLNSCRGVIRAKGLMGMSDDDILREFIDLDLNVEKVNRLILKKNGAEIKTNTFFLTFNTTILPDHIIVGNEKIHVDLYIPSPLRCYNCQKFGHGSKNCNSNRVCGRCGSNGHKFEDCKSDPKCINCKGDHFASFKECPVWLKEKEIVTIKTKRGISYPQAKIIYENDNKTNRKNISFVQAVNSNSNRTQNIPQSSPKITCEMGTQTDNVWNMKWLQKTLLVLKETDPSFFPSLLRIASDYVSIEDKISSQNEITIEEKRNKKHEKKLLKCNSRQNGGGDVVCDLESSIGIEKNNTNDINVKSISVNKTRKVEKIVLDSSDYQSTSSISETNMVNPDLDCHIPMEISESVLSTHKDKIDHIVSGLGEEPRNVLSGKNSQENLSNKNGN